MAGGAAEGWSAKWSAVNNRTGERDTASDNADMAERRGWARDELLLAMNLYCKLAFGQLHARQPCVIALAEVLGRSANSVAMKLCNFASFDPALAARGIKGLQGASRADRAIWDEFHADWTGRAAESEQLAREKGLAAAEELVPSPLRIRDRVFEGETETIKSVRVRLGQSFFRATVLASYGMRCCVTGNPVPELLVASHILPWSTHPDQRVNPRNGLCLSRLHDAAFDAGLITFDESCRLVLSKRLKVHWPCPTLEESFGAYEGTSMRLPEKFRPEADFLTRHREEMFEG